MTQISAGAVRVAGSPAPGDRLGVYRLDAVLGEGGMGVVYVAEHTRLGRKVALKLLRPELGADPTISARFLAEARAVNAIDHPNVVDITDIVEENGYKYYIMELLRGESLAAIEQREGLLPLEKVLEVALQLAGALAAAHDADIVHCDVKPDNVFVETGEGGATTVKLIDFGIAQLPGALGARVVSRPGVGELVGTPAYMSPEQSGGGPVTYETDVYSFGVLLYQVLAGRLPFEADTVEDMVLNHLGVTPVAPSAKAAPDRRIPPELDELVLHCLAKTPDARPGSMQEVELRLARLREDVRPKPRRGLGRGGPVWKNRGVQLAAGAAAALVVVAVVLALVLRRHPGATRVAADPPAAATQPSAPAKPHSPTVVVSFDSVPHGAVVRDEGGKLLGVTPFRAPQPRGKQRKYVFELAGYAAAMRRIVPGADTSVSVKLVEIGKADEEPQRKPARRRGGR